MKKKRRKIKVFCRLYKYICALCGKERHKRHFVKPGETCASCVKKQPPKDQQSLFGKVDEALPTNQN